MRLKLSSNGFSSLDEIIGRTDLLDIKKEKSFVSEKGLNLDAILNHDAESGLPIKSNMKLRFQT